MLVTHCSTHPKLTNTYNGADYTRGGTTSQLARLNMSNLVRNVPLLTSLEMSPFWF